MFYQIPELKNQQLAQKIRNGELQGGQFEYRIENGQIHVMENVQLRQQLEQNINAHFKFILKISFYKFVFDEIDKFIQKFEVHFNLSVSIFDMWSHLDKLIVQVNDRIIWAQSRKIEIQQQKDKQLERKELDKYKGDVIESFLNREFMENQATKVQQEAQQRARDQAIADTTIQFGQEYLKYFLKQKEKQGEFYQVLQNIQMEWQKDQETFEEGSKFLKQAFENQLQIYNNKVWNQDSWTQQFNQQTKQASPFFQSLHQKYIDVYEFYLELYKLNQLIEIQQQTQQAQIELSCKEAEEQFNRFFLKYWQKKFDEENLILQIFKNYDKAQRLKECHQHINQQVIKIQEAFNSIRIDTKTSIGGDRIFVSQVKLLKDNIYLNFENSDNVKQSQDTLEQIKIINFIQSRIKFYEQELNLIQILKDKLEDLKKEPKRIEQMQQQKLRDKRNEGKLLQVQFNDILRFSQSVNFDELYFGRQGFQQILVEFNRYLVVKQTPCCLGCQGRKKLHECDEIYYEDFQDEVASVIRTIQNVPNSWCTSSVQRIQRANNLNAIRTGTQLLINCRIMAALRNDDGQRQINGQQRVFQINRSIVRIIQEICQVTIGEYRSQKGLRSSSSNLQFSRWESSFAKNQVIPQN